MWIRIAPPNFNLTSGAILIKRLLQHLPPMLLRQITSHNATISCYGIQLPKRSVFQGIAKVGRSLPLLLPARWRPQSARCQVASYTERGLQRCFVDAPRHCSTSSRWRRCQVRLRFTPLSVRGCRLWTLPTDGRQPRTGYKCGADTRHVDRAAAAGELDIPTTWRQSVERSTELARARKAVDDLIPRCWHACCPSACLRQAALKCGR